MTAVLKHYNPPKEPYLPVIYSDDQFIAVDKPSGLLSVPGKPDDHKDSVEARAKHLYGFATAVHRLDMETSGIMLVALNKAALATLQQQFEKRTVEKLYRAQLHGCVTPDTGTIDLPLRTDWPNRPKQMVDAVQGKKARTDYRVINIKDNVTTVEFMPLTGRTHQLRVHAAAIGYPILGDRFYGNEECLKLSNRLQLHASTLIFSHPTNGDRLSFEAPCPF